MWETMISDAEDLDVLCRRVRELVDEVVIPLEDEVEAAGEGALELLAPAKKRAKAEGLWALGHPREIGGGGLDLVPFAFVNEVIGRSEWAQHALGTVSMQDSIMLHRFGTPAQQGRWLVPLVNGDILPSVAMTEPEVAGSDPTLMQSRAWLDGDEWVLRGHKWFTTGATVAAFTTVFCETEPDAPERRRFSAFLCPTDAPGYEIVRVVPTMGHVTGQHCEIRLHDVRLPTSALLGERGAGLTIAQARLGPGRIFHCMRWLGQAQRAFELMCARANQRFAHGSMLAEKGEIQAMVADSAVAIHAARLMTLDAAARMDRGEDARVEISLIKFWGARMLHTVIDNAIQVHGALGLTSDTPLERMYRAARYARIYDGPDEVHRMVVARRLLGNLDAVPWGDR